MTSPVRLAIVALVAVFLLSGVLLIVMLARRPSGAGPASSSLTPDPGMDSLSFPEFSLVDQDGRPFTRESLLGHPTVVDFVFTHCPFICPTLSERMQTLTRRLSGSGVRFLSVSVDPAHDTPAALKAYADRLGADTSRWTFATGEPDTIKRIVSDGLKFALYGDPNSPIRLPDGSMMDNIVHPPFFVLLGSDAQVLGLYPVVRQPESLADLETRARAVDALIKR